VLRRSSGPLRRTVQNTLPDRSKPCLFAADPQNPVHDTTTYTTNTNTRTNTPPHTLPLTRTHTHAHTVFGVGSGAPRLPVSVLIDGERPLIDSCAAPS